MIIRKKNNQSKTNTAKSSSNQIKSNILKKEDLILNVENVENTNDINEIQTSQKQSTKSLAQQETFEKIDISSIEFKERIERRRGDRRRGYRRIDERSLVTRAQQEAHSIKELAAREGYQSGLKKANEELQEIKTTLVEFLESKDKMYEEFIPHIMEISMEVTKKIIKKEVEMSNEILKNVVLSTLEEVNCDAQKLTIKVNSEDLEFASASLPEIIETKMNGVKINFAADDTIEKGSCLILANNGVIDANFKTQLSALQNAFGMYKGGI